MNPRSLFRRLAGNWPGVLLWLAVLPLPSLGQANYATPYTFTTLAGQAGNSGSANGTNSAARFYQPVGVTVDSAGNLYVTDEGNNTIRKVTPAGVVTTLAGLAGVSGSADGTNSNARFYTPGIPAVDNAGNIYVPDGGNSTIRKVTPVGTNWVVTTIAGLAGSAGSVDGTNRAARFNFPTGVAVDGATNLYVADEDSYTIRKATPVGTNWVVTTLAGRPGATGGADGTNSAARFYYPVGVALDTAGNLYVADQSDFTIRKMTPVGTNWVVTTLAGQDGSSGSTDGTGSAALFSDPVGVAVDSAGNVYVAEYENNTVRKGFPPGCVPAPMLQPPSITGAGQYRFFRFEMIGIPSLVVNLESSTNLSNWQVVTPAGIILNGGSNSYSVSFNPAVGAQFFRAQVR